MFGEQIRLVSKWRNSTPLQWIIDRPEWLSLIISIVSTHQVQLSRTATRRTGTSRTSTRRTATRRTATRRKIVGKMRLLVPGSASITQTSACNVPDVRVLFEGPSVVWVMGSMGSVAGVYSSEEWVRLRSVFLMLQMLTLRWDWTYLDH